MCNKLVLKVFNKSCDKLHDFISQYPYVEPFNVERIFDVSFSADKDFTFDLYRPINTDVLPVIIDIHGGGWYRGRKENNKAFAMELAKKGFAVFCPEYTRSPTADVRVQVKQIVSFVNWLEQNHQEYRCDLNRVFLCGDSAGGQLASTLLNCTLNKRVAEYFKVSTSLRPVGACFIGGVLYVDKMARLPLMSAFFKPILGKKYSRSRLLDYLNFPDNVSDDCPPILLVTSDEDFIKRDSVKAEKALSKKGIKCELFSWGKSKDKKRKLSHVFNIIYPNWEESLVTNTKISAFFTSISAQVGRDNEN